MDNLIQKLVNAIPLVILLAGLIQIVFQLWRYIVSSVKGEQFSFSVKNTIFAVVVEILVFEGMVAVAFFVIGDESLPALFIRIYQSLVALIGESL